MAGSTRFAGVLSAALLVGSLGATAAQARITFDFDYSFDVNGFFSTSTANGQAARAALNAAADYYSDRFLDSFSAITPGGSSTWTARFINPGDGSTGSVSNLAVGANTLKVYAGGYDLPGNTLGLGGNGGYTGLTGTTAFVAAASTRGQSGMTGSPATDYGVWGGSIRFDTPTNWNFDIFGAPTNSTQSDFLSVATHELGHMLGVGPAASWQAKISNSTFTGAKAEAIYGGPVPVSADAGHINANGTVTGTDTQEALMSPSLVQGTRKSLTTLDWALFDDLGWDLAKPGDADANGTVDFSDLLKLAKNYNTSNDTWSEGDFNYDHTVNFTDLLALAKNYGTSGPLASADAVAAATSASFAEDWALAESLVPEPASLSCLAGIAVVGLRRRR